MASEYKPNFGVRVVTASRALTAAHDAGSVVLLNNTAGLTLTLPDATGSGAMFTIISGATPATGNYVIAAPDSSNVMAGSALLLADGGDTVVGFATVAASDTITMDGTTRGGIKGARIELVDIAANTWAVQMRSDASGTEATPFSAAV